MNFCFASMSFKITKIQKIRQNTADFSDDEPLKAVWAGGLNLFCNLFHLPAVWPG
jgi:hypothetical protein